MSCRPTWSTLPNLPSTFENPPGRVSVGVGAGIAGERATRRGQQGTDVLPSGVRLSSRSTAPPSAAMCSGDEPDHVATRAAAEFRVRAGNQCGHDCRQLHVEGVHVRECAAHRVSRSSASLRTPSLPGFAALCGTLMSTGGWSSVVLTVECDTAAKSARACAKARPVASVP